MSPTDHNLVKGWRSCSLEKPPYLFPGDRIPPTNRQVIYHSFKDFSKDFGSTTSEEALHTGLFPLPYVGNLNRASIFVLLLNPGFDPGDYFAEEDEEYKEVLKRNLRQENEDEEYPFLLLDPKFAWHPGFRWWNKKLHRTTRRLQEIKEIEYKDALRILAPNMACLEVLPYHSESFNESFVAGLESVATIKNYVHTTLIGRAKAGSVTIIAPRGAKSWDLSDDRPNNIIVYDGMKAQSASLTPDSDGGKAILEWLERKNT